MESTVISSVKKQQPQQTTINSPLKLRRFIDLFRSPHDLGFEKQKKQAIYNLIAFSAFLFSILIVICSYFILQQFLRYFILDLNMNLNMNFNLIIIFTNLIHSFSNRPLLWALMFGFVLHPFKQKVSLLILNWISSLNDTHRPAILEVFILPFNLINYFLTTVSTIIIQYGKLLGLIFFALLFIHLTMYYFIFAHRIWLIIVSSLIFVFNLLKSIQSYANLYVLLTLTVGHFSLLCFSWNEDTKNFLIKSTPVIWILFLYKLLLLFNTIGTLFFILLISMLTIGIVAKFYGIKGSINQTDSLTNLSININHLKDQIWNFILTLLPSHQNDEDELELTDESIDESTDYSNKCFNKLPFDASSPLVTKPTIETNLPPSRDKLNDNDLKIEDINENLNLTRLTAAVKSPEKSLKKDKMFKKKFFRRNSLIDKDMTKQIKGNYLSDTYLYALVWSCILGNYFLRIIFRI